MQKTEAIRLVEELRDNYDHVIVDVRKVYEYSTAFGFKLKTYRYPDEVLYDPRHAYGLGSDELARQLCCHFKVKYEQKYGCGSQLHECTEKLLAYFNKQGDVIQTNSRKIYLERKKQERLQMKKAAAKKLRLETKKRARTFDDDSYEEKRPAKRAKNDTVNFRADSAYGIVPVITNPDGEEVHGIVRTDPYQ